MKKFLWALLLAFQPLIIVEATAAPCTVATFGSYQTLGSAGCTVGSLGFSDFRLLETPTFSTPFTTITLAPQLAGPLAGFLFSVSPNSASGTNVFENLIAYRVTASGALIDLASLNLTAAAAGSASVTNVENLCLGGVFAGADGVSRCSGIAVDQIAIEIAGFSDPFQSTTFRPVRSLSVVTDIAVDGGGAGTASITSTSNLFRAVADPAAVPEPGSICLVLLAGVAAFTASRSSGLRRGLAAHG